MVLNVALSVKCIEMIADMSEGSGQGTVEDIFDFSAIFWGCLLLLRWF